MSAQIFLSDRMIRLGLILVNFIVVSVSDSQRSISMFSLVGTTGDDVVRSILHAVVDVHAFCNSLLACSREGPC